MRVSQTVRETVTALHLREAPEGMQPGDVDRKCHECGRRFTDRQTIVRGVWLL